MGVGCLSLPGQSPLYCRLSPWTPLSLTSVELSRVRAAGGRPHRSSSQVGEAVGNPARWHQTKTLP